MGGEVRVAWLLGGAAAPRCSRGAAFRLCAGRRREERKAHLEQLAEAAGRRRLARAHRAHQQVHLLLRPARPDARHTRAEQRRLSHAILNFPVLPQTPAAHCPSGAGGKQHPPAPGWPPHAHVKRGMCAAASLQNRSAQAGSGAWRSRPSAHSVLAISCAAHATPPHASPRVLSMGPTKLPFSTHRCDGDSKEQAPAKQRAHLRPPGGKGLLVAGHQHRFQPVGRRRDAQLGQRPQRVANRLAVKLEHLRPHASLHATPRTSRNAPGPAPPPVHQAAPLPSPLPCGGSAGSVLSPSGSGLRA